MVSYKPSRFSTFKMNLFLSMVSNILWPLADFRAGLLFWKLGDPRCCSCVWLSAWLILLCAARFIVIYLDQSWELLLERLWNTLCLAWRDQEHCIEQTCLVESGGYKLTTCQSRSRLPRCDLEGVIECTNSHTHTKGLPPGVSKRSTRKLDVLAFSEQNTMQLDTSLTFRNILDNRTFLGHKQNYECPHLLVYQPDQRSTQCTARQYQYPPVLLWWTCHCWSLPALQSSPFSPINIGKTESWKCLIW